MPKDWDEGNKRIEGIFGQIGLGNQDPERIQEFQEEYEKAMNLSDQSVKRKGIKFKDVMEDTEETTPGDENVEVIEEE